MDFTIEKERQANEFAYALLMPENIYLEQVELNTDKNGKVNTKAIAEYFGVSISDAANRGYSLGVLERHNINITCT